jgi:internalin A
MKYRTLYSALLVTVIVTSTHGNSTAAGPVTDKNLEAVIRATLHDTKNAPLTDADLNNIYVLEATGKNIKELTGLEKCKNILQLKLTNNQISDLKPLKELTNIQSLDLAGNKISDITPLAGLKMLQYLELSNNQITKADAVKDLTALSALYLSGNKITDLTPVGGLAKLSSLYLDRNQISDLNPLAKVTKLSSLDLRENKVSDLKPLDKQTELRYLILDKNEITDLGPLVEAVKADAGTVISKSISFHFPSTFLSMTGRHVTEIRLSVDAICKGEKRFAPYLWLYVEGNPLSEEAKSKQLPALKSYGVRINQKSQ